MFRKALSIFAMLLLSGLLINGMTMTQQLKKIHASLEDNIESIEQLNRVQASIIQKNNELNQMVTTLEQIDQGLTETTNKTNRTLSFLSSVVDYNADTLHLNNQMVNFSMQSKQQIHDVQSALSELSPSLTKLDQMLKQMSTMATKDKQHLDQILKSTKNLNSKTPRVNLP
ncbi:hypothetical protein ACFO25_18825 [Paenactinomyces guangxiensis]|uniref:Uncharacterized protein n=1 Tax=Paenactinomyces guangxiensis TaxID=1490290 RepID=A0A7W1WRE2_9BACL|nr:hypothetical protein [Paenactinomyces guangxiensis]MBA4494501.1 hypothetical protein [Paenactinomyces guangxiensis]MBH8591444.1 hypothetical protein [Paenactinomyces guangxiensis]